jgi:hypothetical protein
MKLLPFPEFVKKTNTNGPVAFNNFCEYCEYRLLLDELCEIGAAGFSLSYDSYTTVYLGRRFVIKLTG